MKKTVIKKVVKLHPILSVCLRVLFGILICLNLLASVYFVDSTIKLKSQIEQLEERMTTYYMTENHTDETLLSYYRELSDKADTGIDRVIAFSATAVTLIIALSIYLAFRSNREVEKQIEEVKKLAEEAKEAAVDAKYYSMIIDANTDDVNGPPTPIDKIRRINNVIEKYPNKHNAYRSRGVYYSAFAQQSLETNKKEKYANHALVDFNTAIRLGGDKQFLYNEIAVIYDAKNDYLNALEFCTKAIEIDEQMSVAYSNRGAIYFHLSNNEIDIERKRDLLNKSIENGTKAVEIDSMNYDGYNTRGTAYVGLCDTEENVILKIDFLRKSISEFNKTIDYAPYYQRAKDNLKKTQKMLDDLISLYPHLENSNTPQESHP